MLSKSLSVTIAIYAAAVAANYTEIVGYHGAFFDDMGIMPTFLNDGMKYSFFDKQEVYDAAVSRVDECNEQIGTNYTLVATTQGDWVAYAPLEYNETVVDDFSDCLDPGSQLPLLYGVRGLSSEYTADGFYCEEPAGPNLLGNVQTYMWTGKVDSGIERRLAHKRW